MNRRLCALTVAMTIATLASLEAKADSLPASGTISGTPSVAATMPTEAIATAFPATAPAGVPLQYQGVDITLLVAELNKIVYTLNQPVITYHWAVVAGSHNYWATHIPTRDAHLQNWAENMSKFYWDGYKKPSSSIYGDGFYVAVDPIVTNNFGGRQGQWAIFEVHLPVGFRFVSVQKNYTWNPKSIRSTLVSLGCPTTLTLREILGAKSMGVQCDTAMKDIFQRQLHLDGFVYPYSSGRLNIHPKFSECAGRPNGSDRNTALVLLRPETFANNPDVRIYNPLTTDNSEERAQIQGLFYKAADYAKTAHSPGVMSASNAPTMYVSPGKLLWSDLEGSAVPSDLGAWIENNLLGCSATPQYSK